MADHYSLPPNVLHVPRVTRSTFHNVTKVPGGMVQVETTVLFTPDPPAPVVEEPDKEEADVEYCDVDFDLDDE